MTIPMYRYDSVAQLALQGELNALRAELALYRSIVVPKPDYDRAIAERDHAQRNADALTKLLADAQDSRVAIQLAESKRVLTRIGARLRKVTPAADERADFDALWAWLAEHGEPTPEDAAMRRAAEEWLGRRP